MRLAFQKCSDVVDDSLHVVCGLLQLPDSLVYTRQIVQGRRDQCALYGQAATGSVLQRQLCFVEVDDGLVELLPIYAPAAFPIEVAQLLSKLF